MVRVGVVRPVVQPSARRGGEFSERAAASPLECQQVLSAGGLEAQQCRRPVEPGS